MINIAIRAALSAGEAILEIYAQDFEVEYKADDSPLTSADKAAHNLIVAALAETGLPVLSEESKAIAYEERKDWGCYWLVDPIDGTKEFVKKNGEFTVNIALIEQGTPVLGIVFVPVLDVLYCGSLVKEPSAWKAEQCSQKSLEEILTTAQAISVSNYSCETTSRPLRVVASKSHCNEETLQFIAELEVESGAAERVSRGSSLKLCMVAEGIADVYPRIAPTCEWDTGAAHAVVIAAGGQVFEYEEQFSASDYSLKPDGVTKPHAMRYNKENLLNPYFVVSGLLG